jgi:hypothetical protein
MEKTTALNTLREIPAAMFVPGGGELLWENPSALSLIPVKREPL